jgi:hypothetical protein
MVNPSNSVPLPLYGKRSAVDITGSFSYLPEDTNFRFSEGSYYDLSEGTTTNQNNCETSLMRWYGDLSLTFQCLRFAVISTDLKITEFNNHTLYDFGAGGGIRHYNDYVAWIIMMKGYLVKTHHSVSIYETNYGYSYYLTDKYYDTHPGFGVSFTINSVPEILHLQYFINSSLKVLTLFNYRTISINHYNASISCGVLKELKNTNVLFGVKMNATEGGYYPELHGQVGLRLYPRGSSMK